MKIKKNFGFAPIVIVLILAASAVFCYGAYRMARSPASSLVPQEQIPTETPIGVSELEQKTAVEKNVTANPNIGLKPTGLEEKKVQTEQEAFGINFSRAGYLARQSGSGLEGWYLLYDTPGNHATTNPLKFISTSKCDMGQGEVPCDASTFPEDSRVNVDGNIQQNTVTVFLMKKI